MARSFQHGTANRHYRYQDEFAEAVQTSNYITRLKSELNSLLTDDEREAVWDKIYQGDPNLGDKIQRIKNTIDIYSLRALQTNDEIDTTPMGGW